MRKSASLADDYLPGFLVTPERKKQTREEESKIAANSKKTAKPRGTPFEKGVSGNPKGRPKQTPAQKDAMAAIRSLAPSAASVLKSMVEDASTPAAVRMRAVTEILDRTYGKAMLPVSVDAGSGDILSEIRAEVDRIREAAKSDD